MLQEQTNVVFLDVQDVENSKPVFDPDFHSELIINLGNMETYILLSKYPYIYKKPIDYK